MIPEAVTRYAKSYGPDYRAHRIHDNYFQISPEDDTIPVGLPVVVSYSEGHVTELDTPSALAILSLYVKE